MIRYSIIIPHYNIPALLKRCLLSIPDQDDIQVIVVDDNSTDECAFVQAVCSVGHKNVETYLTKEGKGAGYARNIGLKHAKGKWLIFADADDFFTSIFSEKLKQHWDNTSDIVFFNVIGCSSDDITHLNSRGKDFAFKEYEISKDERIFRFGYTEPWGKMVRKSLVDLHGIQFDETQVSNDYLFSIKTGYYAKTISIDISYVYAYTLRSGSLSREDKTINFQKILQRLVSFAHVQKFMEDQGYYSKPAISSTQLVGLFKNHNEYYRKGLEIIQENGLSKLDTFRDTVMHYIMHLRGVKDYSIGLDAYHVDWKIR